MKCFSLVSVDRRKTSQTTDWSVSSTPTNTARTELHSMITLHHANTRGSRAGRLRIANLWVPKLLSFTCHVSVLAAPDTDHKHKFSLTHLTYLSDSLTTLTRSLVLDPYLPCDVPRQGGGSTQIPSLTENRGRTCFFTAVDLTHEPNEVPSYGIDQPRSVPKQTHWRRHQDTLYQFELEFGQSTGLAFSQTIANAIMLNESMPADCLVKVVRR